MRKVMLGTPCLDGRPEVWYVNSVIQTIRLCVANGIEVIPVFMSFDAMIQRARNDLVKLALKTQVDDLLLVDDDQEWEPEQALKLLSYPVDVVGAPIRKKCNVELYNVRASSPSIPVDHGTRLYIVDGIGTGFLKLSRKAMQALWEGSAEYVDDYGKANRMMFNVAVVDRRLVAEDIWMCMTLKNAGFKIYCDSKCIVIHVGQQKFIGDFAAWIKRLQLKAG